MTVIITAYRIHGKVANCGESCYNASKGPCKCICGGRNHGVGLKRALLQNRVNGDAIRKALHDDYRLIAIRSQPDLSCASQDKPKRGSDSIQPET